MSAMQAERGAGPENHPTLRENALVQSQCGSAVSTMAPCEGIQRKTTLPTSLCDEEPGTQAGDVRVSCVSPPLKVRMDGNASSFCTETAIERRAAFKIPGSLAEMFECESSL